MPRKPFDPPHSVEVEETLPRFRVELAAFVKEPLNHGVVSRHKVVPLLAEISGVPVDHEDPECLYGVADVSVVATPAEGKHFTSSQLSRDLEFNERAESLANMLF